MGVRTSPQTPQCVSRPYQSLQYVDSLGIALGEDKTGLELEELRGRGKLPLATWLTPPRWSEA